MGFGKIFRKVAGIALPIVGSLVAPGIGTALSSTLSAATLSGIGGAVGGGVGGAIGGGGVKGALTGAALGGAGGYLSGGGLSDLLSGTALGSSLNSASNSLGFGDVVSPAASAARTATSTAATAAAPSTNFLSGYLPSGGGAAAGGGTSGGFFSNLFGSGADVVKGTGQLVGKTYDVSSLPWLDEVGRGALKANPLVAGEGALPWLSGSNSIKEGVKDVFSPTNLAKGSLKGGLSYLLAKDNASGYGGIQAAANAAGANYQPFLDTGTGATKTLSDLYGLNGPEASKAALDAWHTDPGFTFARDQGIKALDASAARNGMLLSGNQVQDVQKYGTGLADQFFQQYIQNLQKSAGAGQTAAEGVGQNMVDAATVAALMKRQKADRFNQMVGTLSSYL